MHVVEIRKFWSEMHRQEWVSESIGLDYGEESVGTIVTIETAIYDELQSCRKSLLIYLMIH
jgi:hypothetical protein